MRAHWARFGRNYYTRYDYEGVPTDAANGVMAHLRAQLASLPGSALAGRIVTRGRRLLRITIRSTDRRARRQGLRVLFDDGARIVFRLSGTGTEGATIRVYIESRETDAGRLDMPVAEALRTLVEAALSLSEMVARTGRAAPTVIT